MASAARLSGLYCQNGYRAFRGKIALRAVWKNTRGTVNERYSCNGSFNRLFRQWGKRMEAITAGAPQDRNKSLSVSNFYRFCAVTWHICCEDVLLSVKAKVWGLRVLVHCHTKTTKKKKAFTVLPLDIILFSVNSCLAGALSFLVFERSDTKRWFHCILWSLGLELTNIFVSDWLTSS